jgi:hypothetical protein
MDEKLRQLEEATANAQSALLEKEAMLVLASDALNKAKTKLKSLDMEVQRNLQVNDTELPELMSAQLAAVEERDAAMARYETNRRYLSLLKDRIESTPSGEM